LRDGIKVYCGEYKWVETKYFSVMLLDPPLTRRPTPSSQIYVKLLLHSFAKLGRKGSGRWGPKAAFGVGLKDAHSFD